MAKDNCVSCRKDVGKTSHALQYTRCAGWIHVGCDGTAKEDFAFMKTQMRYGFRWYGQCCLSSQTREGALTDISGDIIKTMRGEIFERMSRIESRLGSSGNAGRPVEPTPETFASIVRKALQESRKKEQNQEEAITVSAFGQTKTVQDRQVLIVKPKSGGRTDSTKLTQATDDVRSALKSIPVDNIRKTNTGSLVVKFPTAEAKSEASDLMSSCFENNNDYVVSQPKKMLPKMTLTGIPSSFPEGEIIDGILSKNKKIKNLCEEGLHLCLLFVKQKDQSEHKVAVLKMALEIRKAVNETGVMYNCVSRNVGHTIDSGSRSVSTVRDLVILPLSIPRKTKPQSASTALVIINLQTALISLIQNVLIALLVPCLVCLAAIMP